MTSFALRHRVFVMALALVAMLYGAITFLTMPRREDPEILIRTAIITSAWPGASALRVDELVVDVIEESIQSIDEVADIRSEAQSGIGIVKVDLDQRITQVDQVWDEVRSELQAIAGELPPGASAPILNSNFGDVASVALVMHQTSLTGDGIRRTYTDREMEVFAELVEDELEALPSVGGVTLHGIAEERIYIEISAAEWAKLGLIPEDLRIALDDRNIVVASGEVQTAKGRFLLRASGSLDSLDDFGDVVVGTDPNGLPLLLQDLPFRLRRGIEDPRSERVRFIDQDSRSDRSVLLSVEMKGGANVVTMGADVQTRLDELRASMLPPDLVFATVNDLPRQVDNLVLNFVDNLWQAILIVLVVALLMMGWRPAIVMAAAVPLCIVTAVGVVRVFDVELEQFSIASLIIALGMIVDNAIVVSDQTGTLVRQGETRMRSAIKGASDLAIPILTSTLTTVAAFLPLLTVPGDSGEYIRSLPIVVSVTLLASYFVAMTVTPILCSWLLKPKQEKEVRENIVLRLYGRVIRTCLGAKKRTLAAGFGAVVASTLFVPFIGSQFFPEGVRDQIFVHVRLPYGATIEQTNEAVQKIEDVLVATSPIEIDSETTERLENAFTIIGSGGPRLLLTMDPEDPAPHYAFMVINTTDKALSDDWAISLRDQLSEIPGLRIEVRDYVLGPPVERPVEYRISGPDPQVLREAGEKMVAAMREVEGMLDPYHEWGNSTYQVQVDIDPQKVTLAGLTNRSVANSLNGILSGTPLTDYREGDYSVPVILRLDASERSDLEVLEELYVGSGENKVPLNSVATITTSWQPALITRFDRRRSIIAGSQVENGYLATQVSANAKPAMEAVLAELPSAYKLEELGEVKEASKGAADMGKALLYSMTLIFLVLIAQYNSVAKPIVVLSAIPLALIGALTGLFVTGWSLGFMPMLGIISLAGVVINNAIILIDFIQSSVKAGSTLAEAVEQAGKARMRPIVLTTMTTVGGLAPLALFGGPLWAGMSYAMIFGLLFSTVLTLVVIPTLYVAFVSWLGVEVVQEALA
ncbi:MAG: efflux RND transporter permease subunit [Planctomycetota bacterium]